MIQINKYIEKLSNGFEPNNDLKYWFELELKDDDELDIGEPETILCQLISNLCKDYGPYENGKWDCHPNLQYGTIMVFFRSETDAALFKLEHG